MNMNYWANTRGHICVNTPCSLQSVPVIGLFTGNEALTSIEWITKVQQTGLDMDHYCSPDHPPDFEIDLFPLTTDEKRAILMEKKNEKPIYYLSDIYKGIVILSVRDFLDKSQTYYEHGRVYSGSGFVPIITPPEFNYTVRKIWIFLG